MSSLPKIKLTESSRPQLRGSLAPSTRYLQKREQNWDGRFYVQKMPEFKDGEPLSLFQKLKFLDPTIKSGRSFKQASSFAASKERADSSEGSKASERSVFKLKVEMKKAWEENKVIESHRTAFLRVLENCTIKRARKYIKRELKHNEEKKSSVFTLMRAVAARQNCQKKLYASLDTNSTSDNTNTTTNAKVPYSQLPPQTKSLLKDFLELTIFTIESLLKWRSQLEKQLKRDRINKYHLKFQQNGENYLDKIVKEGRELCERTGIDTRDIFFVQEGILDLVKVRGCELILVEEAMVQTERLQ